MVDKIIVENARKKDEIAIQKLVELTYKKTYIVVVEIIKDEAQAKDILQEAYVTAFKKIDQLKEDEKFDSWLVKIATNKTIDYLRSTAYKSRPAMFSEMDKPEDELQFEENIQDTSETFRPEENVNYSALKEGLKEVMDELPETQRMALMLYYFQQFSAPEIAKMYGVSTSTVKGCLTYGKKKIKEKIEQLRKENRSFYGVAPIPFLVWMVQEQYNSLNTIQAANQVVKVVAEGASVTGVAAVGGTGTKILVDKGAKHSIAKWWTAQTAKVKIGVCVATTAIVGGGVYATQSTETTTWTTPGDRMAYTNEWLDENNPDITFVAYSGKENYIFEYNTITKKIKKIVIENIVNKDEMYSLVGYDETRVYEIDNTYNNESYNGDSNDSANSEYFFRNAFIEDGLYKMVDTYNFENLNNLTNEQKDWLINQVKSWCPSIVKENGNSVQFVYSDAVKEDIENTYYINAMGLEVEKK